MEAILIGLGIYLLTFLVEKLKKKMPRISLRVVVIFLCLIAGTVYYFFNTYYPMQREATLQFITGAFAVSQAIWMVVDKFLPKDSQKLLNEIIKDEVIKEANKEEDVQ